MSKLITRRQFVRGGAAAAGLVVLSSCTPALLERGEAARAAVRTNAKPPKLLLDGLKHKDLVINADAARLLGDLGSPAAVGPLVSYVLENPHYAKTAGLDALARLGDREACPQIRPLLTTPNVVVDNFWYGCYSVRIATALALLALGDDSGAEFLMNPSPEGKEWALFVWFGPTALRLPDRPAACKRVKARMTVAHLLPPEKSDAGQIVVICDSLGLLATPEARRALAGLLSHQSRYVRGRAAMNLMACSSSAMDLASVKKVAESDAALFARVKAAQALAMRGHPSYAEPIRAAVTAAGMDDFDRAAALDSLGLLRRPEDAPLVAAQLKAADAYVRLCAAEALERIGTSEALAAVAAARSDTNLRVRMVVEKCLAASAA